MILFLFGVSVGAFVMLLALAWARSSADREAAAREMIEAEHWEDCAR